MHAIEKFFADFRNTLTFISGAIVIVTFFVSADTYIDGKINEKINNVNYINNLSKILRPFSIADDKGSIIYDHGGEVFIKNINVNKNNDGDIDCVTITTNSFLHDAPLLNVLDWQSYFYTSERISSYVWKYTINTATVWLDGKPAQPYPAKIIIEILR